MDSANPRCIFKGDGDPFPFPSSTFTDRITRSHASALHTAVVWSFSISVCLSLTSYVTLPRPLFDSWFSMPSVPETPKKMEKILPKEDKNITSSFCLQVVPSCPIPTSPIPNSFLDPCIHSPPLHPFSIHLVTSRPSDR